MSDAGEENQLRLWQASEAKVGKADHYGLLTSECALRTIPTTLQSWEAIPSGSENCI